MRDAKRPLYAKMFAASDFEQQFATKLNPVLEDVVTTTGDRLAEELIKSQNRANAKALLFPDRADNRPAVLIASSWGADSLVETVGTELFVEAARLSRQYRFIISVHPNNTTRSSNKAC